MSMQSGVNKLVEWLEAIKFNYNTGNIDTIIALEIFHVLLLW